MKKMTIFFLSVFLLICSFGTLFTLAATQTPAERAQQMVYETEDSNPQLFEYINGVNWISEIVLARSVPQEAQRDYSIDKNKTVGMYNLGNRYAEGWRKNKDEVFNSKQKIWAFPYYNAGELDGAVVIFNTEPYSYSILMDNSNRLLNLLFDAELLDSVLKNNNIREIQDCKAIFGTYSASPSVIYLNGDKVLPIGATDYYKIPAVSWQEFVDKQAEEDGKGSGNGLAGGSGVATFYYLTNKQIENFVLIFLLVVSIVGVVIIWIKRRPTQYMEKVRRYRIIGTAVVFMILFNFISVDLSPIKAEATEEEAITMDQLPDAVYHAIESEITENTELLKEGHSDLYSITTTENDGTKTIFSFQEPIKFKDKDNKIKFKSDKVKKVNQLFSAYEFQNGENDITACLPKKIKDGVLLESENLRIRFRPVTNKNVKAEKKTVTFHDITEEVVVYPEVFGTDTALQYKPLMNGLKENIVLNQYTGRNTFQFYVDIGSLEPAYLEGESIPLLDPDTKEISGILGQVDARDSFEGDCPDTERHFTLFNSLKLELDQKNGYILTVTVDREFLESETTVYPVVIDPMMNVSSSSIADTTVYSNYPNKQTYYTSSYLNVGNHGSYGEGRALVKITDMTPYQIIVPDNLIDVTYHVYEGSGRTTNAIVRLMDSYGEWSQDTVTWNTMPTRGPLVSDVQIHGSGWQEFPLKNMFAIWLAGARGEGGFTADSGFYLMAYDSWSVDFPESRHFCSAEHSTYKPYFRIDFNASVATMESGVYYIKNVQSGKYMDVYEQSTTSQTNVHQWQFHGGQSQQWMVSTAGEYGYYYIRPMHAPTRSLDVANNYSSNGSNIWIYGTNYTGDSAKWMITDSYQYTDGAFRILNKASGKAVVVQDASSANGANIVQFDYTSGESRNDDWMFERADTTLNVPLIPQMQSAWCWAASGEMLAKTPWVDISEDQWDAVEYVKGDIVNEGGFAWECAQVATYLDNSGISFYSSYSIYQPSNLTRILREGGVPIGILWGWLDNENKRNNGHYVVIYGFYYDSLGNLVLKIKDPCEPNIGSIYTISYHALKRTDYDRVWEAVVVKPVSCYANTVPAD